VSSPTGEPPPPGPVETLTIDVHPGSVLLFTAAAAVGAAAWAVVTIAPDMLTGIAVGGVLGLALSPVVSALEVKLGRSRLTAASIVGSTVVVFFAGVILLVAPAAVDQASEFSEELPATVRDLYSWPVVGDRLQDADAAREVEKAIEDLPARIDEETIADLGERLLGGALSAVIVVITAIGVLVDGPTLVRRVRGLVPEARRERADATGRIVYHSFGSYFSGSLLVAVLHGVVILSTGLVLGVPLAPVAALWSTLTNLIPQVGGFLGGSFFVALALTQSPVKALIAAAVFLGYQQLENNVVAPAIVGTAVNLTPPTTMLAALVGGAAAGVPGALVATPLVGAAKALYLERQGKLPPPKEAVLRRRLKARVAKAKELAEGITDSISR
jgi:predicted PurR-regulated permease PerM